MPALQKLISVYPVMGINSFERESYEKYSDRVIPSSLGIHMLMGSFQFLKEGDYLISCLIAICDTQ